MEPGQPREDKIPYAALCRGAAVYVLLGKHDLEARAVEIAGEFDLDPARVRADIEAIVRAERAQVGGVFEAKPMPKGSAN